jgi:hypothetical protein
MIRAGVVRHPSEWAFSGYNEIQSPRERYALIDYAALKDLLDFRSMNDLAKAYRGWVEESVQEASRFRDGKWTESVAVGSEEFVTATKEELGFKAKGREVVGGNGSFELKESLTAYRGILEHENAVLSPQNQYLWQDMQSIST